MSIKKILQTISAHDRFVVTAHVHPDPDALCSERVMADFLRGLGKKATVVNEAPVPERFHFLPGIKNMRSYKQGMRVPYDVMIVLDCGELDRIGRVQELITPEKIVINIDHHITNDAFGDVNLVNTASSTAEVLYDVLKAARFPLTKRLAELIYVGIMTDTGSFRYDNTTEKTHKIAGELMSFGFPAFQLYRQLYESIPLADMAAFTKVISNFAVHAHQKVLTVELPKDIQVQFSEDFDLKDMVFKFLRTIKNVEAFMIFTEIGPKQTRVNFRSSGKVDVARLAHRFGGGGHRNASGCMIDASMSMAKKKLLSTLNSQVSWKAF